MWLGKNNECHEGRGQDLLDSRLVSRASWHSDFWNLKDLTNGVMIDNTLQYLAIISFVSDSPTQSITKLEAFYRLLLTLMLQHERGSPL